MHSEELKKMIQNLKVWQRGYQFSLTLCKIHHAAFDGNIIGVDTGYKITVQEDVLNEFDGPMLKYGIQEMHGQRIILSAKRKNRPGREKLKERFKKFCLAG